MEENRRHDARASMLKRAKITFGNPDLTQGVIDCVVVNTSPTGIRVRTAVAASVPEWVTLVIQEGESFRARRRWTQGNEIGFELASAASENLLDAMIAGLTPDQCRALVARIEASLLAKPG